MPSSLQVTDLYFGLSHFFPDIDHLLVSHKIPVFYDSLFQVRIVCMSDTHSMTPHIRFDIPQGDIFIHAGDFTRCGRREEVIEFNEWIGKVVGSTFL